MKNTYKNPICTMIALSSADVITASVFGIGEVFKWSSGTRSDSTPMGYEEEN